MNTAIKSFLITFIFLSNFRAGFSQDENLKIEKISLEQGVSNNLIYSIYQDSKGFIWFGTMFGLVRYDGIDYKTFRSDPLDSNSLSNDDIISIYEDRSGCLWFGTYNGGLNKYDRTTGRFTRYLYDPGNPNTISSNTVWVILQDKKGTMWFATEGGGLNKYDIGKNEFTSYTKDTTKANGINGNFIRALTEDKNGNIWVGMRAGGLNKFNPETGVFINYKNNPGDENSLSNNLIAAVFEDNSGNLWIGTGGGGLNKFEASTGKFRSYKYDSADVNSISSDFVFSIVEESPGVLLLGTQKGLNRFYSVLDKFEKIAIDPGKKSKKEVILAFIKDKSGVLWASSYNDGLYKLSYVPEKFKSFLAGENINCIFEDKSGKLWIGTEENGLQMSEDFGKSFVQISFKENKNKTASLKSNRVNSIAEDNEGNMWTGTDKGLYELDKRGNVSQRFINDPKNDSSIITNNILKVYIDQSGILWAGTDNGLDRFNPGNESFTHFQNIRGDTNSLSENTILSIYEDSHNEFWIGTYFGMNKLDRNSGTFRHYKKNPDDPKTISNNYVFSFCEDSNNNFWIGTGGGLNIFDRNTETFFHFTESDGLPNDVIAGLECSNDGHLWISTFKGISRFSVKEKEFKNYDSYDGLMSNMFNAGSYFKNNKGEILFGSINGVNYFDPSQIKERDFNSTVILTSLIKYDDKNKKEYDISGINEIELSYKDNVINIGFSSGDFTNSQKNKFAYKLEGFENEWIYSGNKNEAIYTNLNPGEYVFKVRATNSDGVWSSEEASLKIIITPPFWKTWWFYGILAFMLIGSIILIQNYRIRLKVKNLIELEKIKEKEREQMREQASRDYHDELGHKLTRISLYSRRINKKLRPTANGLTEDLNSIVETSNSLQSGAKDLIWAMNPKEDTLYDFTVRLRDFGNELFENTGINFTSDRINDEYKNIFLSMNCKRHMIYIFKEGMNNILKYSRCANVRLTFLKYGDDIEIVLSDDGKGFDINNCPKGYGLKNIFSRAKQINVNVNILSEERKGTTIKLKARLPDLISV